MQKNSHYNSTLNEIFKVGHRLGYDYNGLDFLGPIGWGLIASFSKSRSIELGSGHFKPHVAKYMNFIGLICNEEVISENNPHNIFKLEYIYSGLDCDGIADKICGIAEKFLNQRNDQLVSNLRYFLSELTLNIPQHSGDKKSACICGQYYKDKNVLQIAIVDSGKGIYESLRHTRRISNDLEAILEAIKPGVTGNPGTGAYEHTATNMGYGIPACKNTISCNSGDFFLGSGNKLLAFNGHGKEIDENYQEQMIDLPFNWQGTFIVVNLYTNKMNNVDYGYIFDLFQSEEPNQDMKLDFIE